MAELKEEYTDVKNVKHKVEHVISKNVKIKKGLAVRSKADCGVHLRFHDLVKCERMMRFDCDIRSTISRARKQH